MIGIEKLVICSILVGFLNAEPQRTGYQYDSPRRQQPNQKNYVPPINNYNTVAPYNVPPPPGNFHANSPPVSIGRSTNGLNTNNGAHSNGLPVSPNSIGSPQSNRGGLPVSPNSRRGLPTSPNSFGSSNSNRGGLPVSPVSDGNRGLSVSPVAGNNLGPGYNIPLVKDVARLYSSTVPKPQYGPPQTYGPPSTGYLPPSYVPYGVQTNEVDEMPRNMVNGMFEGKSSYTFIGHDGITRAVEGQAMFKTTSGKSKKLGIPSSALASLAGGGLG